MRCGYEKLSLKLRDSEAENLIKLESSKIPVNSLNCFYHALHLSMT